MQAQLRRLKAEKDAEADAAAEATEPADAHEAAAVAADAQKRQAGEIRYTWGGPAKQPQNPQPVKAAQPQPVKAAEPQPVKPGEAPWVVTEPEPVKPAEAPWVVTEPDDKTPDPADESNQAPAGDTAPITRHLPSLFELIEQGKVLALNMPAGINPALARAVGVMLKNAWLQALLMRPAKMKANPGRYFRPAVFNL